MKNKIKASLLSFAVVVMLSVSCETSQDVATPKQDVFKQAGIESITNVSNSNPAFQSFIRSEFYSGFSSKTFGTIDQRSVTVTKFTSKKNEFLSMKLKSSGVQEVTLNAFYDPQDNSIKFAWVQQYEKVS